MNLLQSAAAAGRRKLAQQRRDEAAALRGAAWLDAKHGLDLVQLDNPEWDHGSCAPAPATIPKDVRNHGFKL